MIKAIIIEDEPVAVQIIEGFIRNIDEIELLKTFNAAEPALSWLHENDVDVIFQDINLPSLNGVDLVKSLPNPPAVIFTTANPEYAVEGFELEAVDYLVKPIAFERFKKAIDKLIERLQRTSFETGSITLKTNNRTYIIKKADIQYLQSSGDYIKVFSKQHNLVVNTTMKEMEQALNTPFIRVHKSYIVNKDAVEYIEGNSIKVNDQLIPIGATYRKEVFEALK